MPYTGRGIPVCRYQASVGKEAKSYPLGGPFCESGDVIIEDLPMPKIEEGDLIAVPMSGAYHLSMSSNYNGARRPAVLMVDEGNVTLIQRRELIEDLLRRDLKL